jgi:Lrp/AsnC family leucine-responsive transcriptional regulator
VAGLRSFNLTREGRDTALLSEDLTYGDALLTPLFAPNGTRLDAIDLRILVILHENARTPSSDIAEAIGLSPSATVQRIKRLDEGGAIQCYSAEADESMFGDWSLLMVEIELQATAKRDRGVFETLLRGASEVVQAFELMGRADYVVVAAVAAVAQWSEVQTRIDPDGSIIARVSIEPMVRTLKRRSAHPALLSGKVKPQADG